MSKRGNTHLKKETLIVDVIVPIFTAVLGAVLGAVCGNYFGKTENAIIYNNKQITTEEFVAFMDEKDELTKQVIELKSDLKTEKELSGKLNTELSNIKNINKSLYDVKFDNLNLILNGIDTGYNGRVVTINNETFYSINFFDYLLDNQAISADKSKLFIGEIQSEEQMPISLFTLDPFTEDAEISTNFTDRYNNQYDQVLLFFTDSIYDDEHKGRFHEYFIDKTYKKFICDIAVPHNIDGENSKLQLLVYGDDVLLSTTNTDPKTNLVHVETNIENVKFLQLVTCSNVYAGHLAILNAYLYP